MTAKKYTKKPVQIEALLYTGGTDSTLFLAGALATHRLTRLITLDEITRPARSRLYDRLSGERPDATPFVRTTRKSLAYLLTCPWCVSVYAGTATALLQDRRLSGGTFIKALAYSTVAGTTEAVIDRLNRNF